MPDSACGKGQPWLSLWTVGTVESSPRQRELGVGFWSSALFHSEFLLNNKTILWFCYSSTKSLISLFFFFFEEPYRIYLSLPCIGMAPYAVKCISQTRCVLWILICRERTCIAKKIILQELRYSSQNREIVSSEAFLVVIQSYKVEVLFFLESRFKQI